MLLLTRSPDHPIRKVNPVKRHVVTKLQTLEARHPGLIEKVSAMFEEFWPTQDVQHMIQAQYGERLSMNTVARYKRKHWQARRELVREMSQVIGPSSHRVIWPSEEQKRNQPIN